MKKPNEHLDLADLRKRIANAAAFPPAYLLSKSWITDTTWQDILWRAA